MPYHNLLFAYDNCGARPFHCSAYIYIYFQPFKSSGCFSKIDLEQSRITSCNTCLNNISRRI